MCKIFMKNKMTKSDYGLLHSIDIKPNSMVKRAETVKRQTFAHGAVCTSQYAVHANAAVWLPASKASKKTNFRPTG